MNIVLWNLEQLDVTERQKNELLLHRVIYDPNCGDKYDAGEGIFYPEDGYTLDDIQLLINTGMDNAPIDDIEG